MREGGESYVESIGDNAIFFIFYAFGDFIFLRAQKNEAKKGRPCGGLAQRKSFMVTPQTQVAFRFWEYIGVVASRTCALCVMALIDEGTDGLLMCNFNNIIKDNIDARLSISPISRTVQTYSSGL